MVNATFEPDSRHLREIARKVGAEERDVREAILGLEARACLTQETIGFPGIETVHFWKVHPQLQTAGRPAPLKHRSASKKDC
jgi:hypothetical protein